MFSIVIPPLKPPRLTPEEKEPYCFTCGEQIGKGAFSVVYALSAPSSALAAKVMIKRDLPSEHVEQLVQEMRVLRTLHHPNIICLEATHEDEETLSIIMERAGCDLLECLQKGGLFSELQGRRLMRQLFSALEFCHANGVIHRDVKPENLLLFGDSRGADVVLKVADFGTVRILDDNFGRSRRAASPATPDAPPDSRGLIEAMRAMVTSTSRVGSSLYMAPEVCWRKPYGELVDVWSAGVVLHVLLSGQPAWPEGRTPHPVTNGGNPEPSYSAPVWEGTSPELRQLMQGVLAVDPATRLTAARALAAPWFSAKLPDDSAGTVRAWLAAALPTGAAGKESESESPQSIDDALVGMETDGRSPVESPRFLPALLSPQTVGRQCFGQVSSLSCCAARKGGGKQGQPSPRASKRQTPY